MYIVDSHSRELFLCRCYTKETLSEDISSTIIITSPQLWPAALILINKRVLFITRSRWLNCALRHDEAVYRVSIGHYKAVEVDNWWYWVSRGHLSLHILHKVKIWLGVTDSSLTHWLTTLKDRATQHMAFKTTHNKDESLPQFMKS